MVQRRPARGVDARGYVRFIARWTAPDGTHKTKTFSSTKHDRPRAAAVAWENRMRDQAANGAYHDPRDGAIPLRDIVAAWADQATRPGTRENRHALLGDLGPIAHTPLNRLTPAALESWAHTLTTGRPWAHDTPLAPRTARIRVAQLRALLGHAVTDGRIPKSPAARLHTPGAPDAIRPRDLPTPDEESRIMAAAPSWLADAITWAAHTGLRPGELAGLEMGDIHGDTLTVARQITGRIGVATPPKTRHSARTVPVPSVLHEWLADHPRPATAPVLGGATGRGTSAAALNNGLWRARHDARIARKITLHAWRHLYASRLIAAGVPLTDVAAILGHATPAITARVYAHVLPGHLDRVRSAVDAWGKSGANPGLVAR